MFRTFVVVVFVIFYCSVFGQDTVNIKDLQGRKQGYWRKSDSVGRVIYVGHFKDGVPVGEFRYYYPDGKLKTVSLLSKQGKRAVTNSYFTNGMKMASGIYINEKKDSTWHFFSEENGKLVSEEHYKDGLIDGLSKVFFPEGGLSELNVYKQGIKDGLWEQYYDDGKIKLRGAFKSGEKQGAFKIFYPSGHFMISGQYNTGHQDGTWFYYNEKGATEKKEIYRNGLLIKVEETAK